MTPKTAAAPPRPQRSASPRDCRETGAPETPARTPPQAARPLEWGAGRFAYRGKGGKVDAENGEAAGSPTVRLSRDGAAGTRKTPAPRAAWACEVVRTGACAALGGLSPEPRPERHRGSAPRQLPGPHRWVHRRSAHHRSGHRDRRAPCRRSPAESRRRCALQS